jgi:hypothetical protein
MDVVMSHRQESRQQQAVLSAELTETEIAAIRQSLQGLRYGIVQIIVQDGVIVQIDRTEKRRLRGQRSSAE